MKDSHPANIFLSAMQWIGKTVSINNLHNHLDLIDNARNEAKKHDWLHHCTNRQAFLSIIKNNELWLSNLKCVNDREEAQRINAPEFENCYYVGSFTYDKDISNEHWKEYGTLEDGILFGFKRNWVKREATFLDIHNQKVNAAHEKIYSDQQSALEQKIADQNTRHIITNPFYIFDHDFYQILYDNHLKNAMSGQCSFKQNGKNHCGRALFPELAGIIKSKKGTCQREGKDKYKKSWEAEKEVRLKVGIQQVIYTQNAHSCYGSIVSPTYFPKIAVPLTPDAWDTLLLKFSPQFNDKEEYINNIRDLLPDSQIQLLE